jgi:hypothetical protein
MAQEQRLHIPRLPFDSTAQQTRSFRLVELLGSLRVGQSVRC